MSPEHWRSIKDLFSRALELPEDQRLDFCRSNAPDQETATTVEQLLHSERVSKGLFEQPLLTATLAREFLRSDDDLTGTSLGPYSIVRKISEGNLSVIYQGERNDGLFTRTAAMKVFRGGRSELDRQVFLREFIHLAVLHNPGLCQIYDAGYVDLERPYAVLEWIDGENVNAFCDKQRLTVRERVAILADAADVIFSIHRSNFVNGDLKTDHILVERRGTPKIIDFGSALKIGDQNQKHTRTFTPEYASPEQIRGEALDPATDVYSFGIVLFRVIVGHYPYQMKGRLLYQITDAVLNQEAEHPAELLRSEPGNEMVASGVSRQAIAAARSCSIETLQSILKSSLSDILLTAVSKPKYRRYKDCGELASDLRIWLNGGKPKAASLKTKYFSRTPTEYTMSGLQAFLCHCSEDKSRVRELYANLRSYGLNIWFDEESLVAGQDWREEIRRTVAEAHLVIVCLSEHSLTKKGFVQREIRFALDVADEQPPGQIYIIPVRLEDCDVPERLQKWQWVNLFEQDGFSRLIRALELRSSILQRAGSSSKL